MNRALPQLAEYLCRERGMRLTSWRRRVLGIIASASQPLGAYDILRELRVARPDTAPVTVYRALDFLLAQGFVHKLGSLHAYIGCDHPNHPHAGQFLVCRDCGRVEEIADRAILRSIDRAAGHSGFQARDGLVEIRGRCRACSR